MDFRVSKTAELDKTRPVLLVDPQQDLRLIITHQLSKLKFKKVLQAKDCTTAFELMKSFEDISLIICSYETPDISGIEFIDEIQADVDLLRPPICLTIYDANKDKIMLAVEKGIEEILVKPFPLADVMPKAHRAYLNYHNPKNPELLYEHAKKLIQEERFQEAKDIYSSLSKLAVSSARPWVGMAHIALAQKKTALALDLLEHGVKNNPHYVHAYTLKAEVYLAQDNVAKALETYREAINLSPLNPIRYTKCAAILSEQNKLRELVDLLEIGVNKGLDYPDIYHHLSQALFTLNEHRSAIKYIRRALSSEPENVLYLSQLAQSLKAIREYDEAIKYYNAVVRIDPDNLQALYNKAILLIDTNKLPDALRILQRVIKKYPQFKKAQRKLGELKAASTVG